MKKVVIISLFAAILIQCKNEPSVYIHKNLCEAIEDAKLESKPLLIHYTSYGLAYNEFHNDFLSTKETDKLLNEKFVVLELYVDDRSKKKNSLQKSPLNCLGIHFNSSKSIGELNFAIQDRFTQTENQPLYQIVNLSFENLIEPFGYTDRNEIMFKNKLSESIENFQNGITKKKLEKETIIAEYMGMTCDCPQWKLLEMKPNRKEQIELLPIDTIELLPYNKETINPLELDSISKYQFLFEGEFYRDKQNQKYEDGQKTINIKTFVYSAARIKE